jgi:hypothetical protein
MDIQRCHHLRKDNTMAMLNGKDGISHLCKHDISAKTTPCNVEPQRQHHCHSEEEPFQRYPQHKLAQSELVDNTGNLVTQRASS